MKQVITELIDSLKDEIGENKLLSIEFYLCSRTNIRILGYFGYYALGIGSTYTDTNGTVWNVNKAGNVTGLTPMGGVAPTPGFKGTDTKNILKGINQLNKLIKTGKIPKSIIRFDKGKIFGELDHVHFENGAALNVDGTWKHGSKVLTNKEIKFLQQNGWTIPNQ